MTREATHYLGDHRVADYLAAHCVGPDDAHTRSALEADLGIPGRELHDILVHLVVDHGLPVCSSSGKIPGYYLATSAADKRAKVHSMRRRGISILRHAKAIKLAKVWPAEQPRQIALFDPPRPESVRSHFPAVAVVLALALLLGCAAAPDASTAVAPVATATDQATIDQRTDSTVHHETDHSLDLNRFKLGQGWQRTAGLAGACAGLVAIGCSLLLLCMPSPVRAHWRAILMVVAISMLASPAVILRVQVW